MTIVLARPTAALVIDEPTVWVDRDLSTASWWDQYTLTPGTYPFEWVNINGRPWNADPAAITSGYIANIGPYYGLVQVKATLTEEYRVNRLLSASSVDHKVHREPQEERTIRKTVYAYELPGCPKGQHGKPLTSFMGGRVVAL